MAYEAVVGETLTPDLEKIGLKLAEQLEKDGIDFNAALWFYFAEPPNWKFILASSLVNQQGQRRVYGKVRKSLSKIDPTISLQDVKVVESDASIVKLLRPLIGTPRNSLERVRVKNNTVNGVLVEDALIYRMA
jgi:hypothetical protein